MIGHEVPNGVHVRSTRCRSASISPDDSLGVVASDFDVVVVGAGLAGAAAAWSVARRGRSVALFEQFEPSHDRGSSHGSARIVRRVYEDALYVSLTGEAFELWREVESAADVSLLRMLGGLDFGPRRNVPAIASVLSAADVPFERLPASEAESRWPGMHFEGDVIFHAQAGTMDAATAVTAFVSLAASPGRRCGTRRLSCRCRRPAWSAWRMARPCRRRTSSWRQAGGCRRCSSRWCRCRRCA
jgi:sarcosine oxidase